MPRPVVEYDELVADAQDQHEVQRHPDQPGEIALHFQERQLYNGFMLADGRHRSFVFVFECFQLLSLCSRTKFRARLRPWLMATLASCGIPCGYFGDSM